MGSFGDNGKETNPDDLPYHVTSRDFVRVDILFCSFDFQGLVKTVNDCRGVLNFLPPLFFGILNK